MLFIKALDLVRCGNAGFRISRFLASGRRARPTSQTFPVIEGKKRQLCALQIQFQRLAIVGSR